MTNFVCKFRDVRAGEFMLTLLADSRDHAVALAEDFAEQCPGIEFTYDVWELG